MLDEIRITQTTSLKGKLVVQSNSMILYGYMSGGQRVIWQLNQEWEHHTRSLHTL